MADCSPCTALYEPNPDIAGQAIFISFLVHTCIFILLAMVVTPIVGIYLPPVGAGDVPLQDLEEVQLIEASGYDRREPGADPQYIYRCHCQEAVQDTYTSQYVAGLAFIVTAFLIETEISYYHFRVIHCIVSMHSTIGLMSNYHRQSFLSFLVRYITSYFFGERPRWEDLKFKMIDFALLLNVVLLWAFTIFIPFHRDTCFDLCYKNDIWTFVGSSLAFLVLLCMAMFGNGCHNSFGAMLFTFCIAGYTAFQSWQFQSLTQTFRPTQLAPGTSSESIFSFGQILVFFMIFPLVADYIGALLVDIGRIQRNVTGEAPPRETLINLFQVLLPWFIYRVSTDFALTVKRATEPLLRQGATLISNVTAMIGSFLHGFETILQRRRNLS
jgi:hypothetical protein